MRSAISSAKNRGSERVRIRATNPVCKKEGDINSLGGVFHSVSYQTNKLLNLVLRI